MPLRFDKESEYHFTTFSTYKNEHLLILSGIPEILLSQLGRIREEYSTPIYGFVIMPNHLHVIWHITPQQGISKIMQLYKGRTSKNCHIELRKIPNFNIDSLTRSNGRFSLWQRKFYDFNILSGKKLHEKLDYVHNNPVKWGLVSNPEDWPYSSFRSLYNLPGVVFEVDRY
jgi:putative transposase